MAEVALTFPFSLNPLTGSIVTTTNQDVIWADRVKLAVETNLGERVMRPSYGTKIPAALFNTVDSFTDVFERDVQRVFVEQLPLLSFESITSDFNERENTLSVDITYSLPNNTKATTKVGVMVVSDINPPYEELAQ
jgi:phage baseplate assembly protein W